MDVRTAKVSDADGIAEIQVSGWRACYPGIMPASYLDLLSVPEQSRRWANTIRRTPETGDVVRLAADGVGHVVGFTYLCIRTPSKPSLLGELRAIYVIPSALRRGIGSALLRDSYSIFRSRRLSAAFLWVARKNHDARRFYEQSKWKRSGGERSNSRLGFLLDEIEYLSPALSEPREGQPARHGVKEAR